MIPYGREAAAIESSSNEAVPSLIMISSFALSSHFELLSVKIAIRQEENGKKPSKQKKKERIRECVMSMDLFGRWRFPSLSGSQNEKGNSLA